MKNYKLIIATAIITSCVLVTGFFVWWNWRLSNIVDQLATLIAQDHTTLVQVVELLNRSKP